MNRDTLREQFATGLRAEAERRFGTARAEALRQSIHDTAGWMAEVVTFPVAAEESPAFYTEPAS
jgi:hypothetical protein